MSETATKKIGRITLKNVRLSFPVLFEPSSFEENGKKEFQASFLFAKESPIVAQLKAEMIAVAKEKWGEKAEAILGSLFRDNRLCLHDGDLKEYDGYAGQFYLRASNKVRPTILDRNRATITEKDGKIYSGCYVIAYIDLWAQDNKFGKRINATLRGVQFLADGDAFAGGSAANVDEFEQLADEEPVATLDSLGF
jgi:hypothetical protein